MFGKNSGGAAWLLVCLGNPGDKYENTRHNVGFMVADEIGERQNAPIQKLKFKALTNVVEYGGCRVLLMKPTTYMNLSGEAVREACMFYKLPPERVLVVSDDVSTLPVLRPLIGMDKEEIVRVARHVGTFDTSILPYEDCCTVFTPRHPKTKPDLEEVREYEAALDIDALCDKALAGREMIRLYPKA